MKTQSIDVIRAWKDPEYRASLTAEQIAGIPENPAGEALSDMEAAIIKGGQVQPSEPGGSGGLICTVSGECMGGVCCNLFTSIIKY